MSTNEYVKKCKKILYKKYNNCAIINKININDYYHKLDNIKQCCCCFKEFNLLYSIKYNYKNNKKYYFLFIDEFDNKITIKNIKDELDKLYKLWYFTINYNNKYYLKFLRRIGYNLCNKLYLYISSKEIDDDAIQYINNINNHINDDYNDKKEFYDFIDFNYINI